MTFAKCCRVPSIGPRRSHIGKLVPPRSVSRPRKTHMFFKCVELHVKNNPLRFPKCSVTMEQHPCFSLGLGLVLALLLATCRDFGFLSQSSGSTLRLATGCQKIILFLFPASGHDSLPYIRGTHIPLRLYTCLTHLLPGDSISFLSPTFLCVA